MPPKKKTVEKPKAEKPKVEKPVQAEKPIQEVYSVAEEFVNIFVPEEAGTPTLEVSINEKVWRLARGEWANNVPKEVAVVIQRSIAADRLLKKQLNKMKITPANPYGQAVQA